MGSSDRVRPPAEDEHREHAHAGAVTGWREFAYDLLVPHAHDAADRVDDVLEAST